jgi:hypothetical protein
VPVIGINSNVFVDGVEFHVQTEDLGPRHGLLVTQVFRDGGCVVKSVKLDYSQHLDKPNLHSVLPRVMKAHHAKLIHSLQQGRLASIPPCVTMRRSLPQAATRLEDIARAAGIEDLPGQSEAPSTVRSNGQTSKMDQPVESTPRSTANLWDRLIEEAHRDHGAGALLNPRSDPRSVFTAWDRAVESARLSPRETRQANDASPLSCVTPAAVAHAEGLTRMRARETELAVANLARAVELEPSNREYRAALRSALDELDAQP